MTIVTKVVDVFNIFVQAANLGLWIYIVLQATKAAQVRPVKPPKQRAFASVDILHRKCVRSISVDVLLLLCEQKLTSRVLFSTSKHDMYRDNTFVV